MFYTHTKRLFLCAALMALSHLSIAQVTIVQNLSAQQLVQRLVGPNVTVLNPVLNCTPEHNGSFTTVSSNLGLSGGIILATGTATSLSGPYTEGVGQTTPTGGDQDLTDLASTPTQPVTTNDACILEFDFLPDVDSASTLSFEYVFGSEEYPGFTCSPYNDVFGFLLTGPGYTPRVNIALVPGTSIPVAINSVNSGVPSGGYSIATCNNMGPGAPFPQYFVDNAGANGQTITLDGFTTVLQATAIVYPCDTYHMKLGIANASDHALQSAVFLKENSFTVDTVTLDLTGIIVSDSGYLVEGCTPATIKAIRTQASTHKKKICLGYAGTAVNGMDYTLLPDSMVIQPNAVAAQLTLFPIQDNIDEPGFEKITIYQLNCCTKDPIDSITIQVRDSLKMALLNKDTSICGSEANIILHATGDPTFTYAWTPPAGIANPADTLTTANPKETTTYTVTAHYQTCPDISRSFTAYIEPIPVVSIWPEDTAFCIADPYPLNVDVQPSTFANYTYVWTPADNLSSGSIQSPSFYTQVAGEYPLVLTVTTPIGCTGKDSIHITARPAVVLKGVSSDFTLKYGETMQLNAEGATYYTWTPDRLLNYPNEHNPTATALDSATFQVIGTDQWGCRDTAYVHMGVDYTMWETVPSAFSPNGDGKNDVFHISNLKYQKLVEFRIFNRWGQEVYNSTDGAKGWDGTYRGELAEVGVYQYLIRIATPDGKMRTYKGDVTLVR